MPPSPDGCVLHVHGILGAGRSLPRGATGIGSSSESLAMVTEEPLAAVVGRVRGEPRARRRDLTVHRDLLLSLGEGGPVLPMRFGTVAPDEDAVRALLVRERDRYAAALDRVADRVEMNLKVLPREEAVPDLVRADPRLRRLYEETRRRPGYEARLRLGERIATALGRRASEAGRETLRRLERRAVAGVPGPPVAGCAVNFSFLVERAGTSRFLEEVDRCAAGAAPYAELRVTGPLPCFSFVPETPGATGHRAPTAGAM
ncbi:GvpL/GvpF family gas vesicle protein [Streptomyces calidiresistens]|uniref:Gas vesicle protein n=1 Tax=Streptomyces calidiresistens TaxID=1485586 RepID=A0A7W3T8J1_9ACTN|nr:GvpL/GvpF family gas vesicle protein [Streptomyces calidiresistens]MBB0232768.1 gas vesicle protein [Streptomyces calidiresistens]